MKLYAKTTSERASKGQGGNEYLDIAFTNEGGEQVAQVVMYQKPWHALPVLRVDVETYGNKCTLEYPNKAITKGKK